MYLSSRHDDKLQKPVHPHISDRVSVLVHIGRPYGH